MPFQFSPEKSIEVGLESSPPLIVIRDLVQVAEKWNFAEYSVIIKPSG